MHKLKGLRLHGKMLLADGERAIVGSINLAPGSFDARRELAIEVDDEHVVGRLEKVAKHDWEHSEPLDLSDEGLMADLEKRGTSARRHSCSTSTQAAGVGTSICRCWQLAAAVLQRAIGYSQGSFTCRFHADVPHVAAGCAGDGPPESEQPVSRSTRSDFADLPTARPCLSESAS